MRPEAPSAREKEKEEAKDIDLSKDEKLVLNLLKENSPVDLNDLKSRTGLSNKKWDTAIKGLRKHNLAKVEKTVEGLFVELV
jgi:lysyl-tRNA synthetase class 2